MARSTVFALVLAMLFVLLRVEPAQACLFPSASEHQLDPTQMADRTPPSLTSVTAQVRRPDDSTSCGDLAILRVEIAATDAQTPTNLLGYEVKVAAGARPSGPRFRASAVRAQSGGNTLIYPFSANSEIDGLMLEVRAVDLNGNRSEPMMVEVDDPGAADGAGCSAAGAESPALAGFLALALAALLGRRRQRAR